MGATNKAVGDTYNAVGDTNDAVGDTNDAVGDTHNAGGYDAVGIGRHVGWACWGMMRRS